MNWLRPLLMFSLLCLVSCSSQAPPGNPPKPAFAEDRDKATSPKIVERDPNKDPGGEPQKLPPGLEAPPADVEAREKYDAALQEALTALADRKLDRALTALETARGFSDTAFIRGEIDKVKLRVEQDTAADRTVQDIQSVLEAGKASEAAKLATQALYQYGGTPFAEPISKLKFQADALTTAQLVNDEARFQQFKGEAQQALADKNLRAAALSLEQALQYGKDDGLRQDHDRVRLTLSNYDTKRAKAAQLRRDAMHLEEAIEHLKEAAQAWDTLQVRQEIDEYSLALQNRRDRVAAADFQVRGDVGIPFAGTAIPEELLPLLKRKYDLVERGQIAKVLAELKLEQQPAFEDPTKQREVAELARVRYMLLGSISQLGGISVHARLVDVRTGLIVQTAKVVAPTPEELVQKLPELARLLLMTDDERLAYEQQQVKVAAAPPPPVVVEDVPLPPAPEPPIPEQALPPPEIVYSARPPDFGLIRVEHFDNLPPPPVNVVQPVIVVEREVVVKRRLLGISLSLGDNLFRRGRYREAQVQFDLALQLAPHEREVRLRIERCQPMLPPPPAIIVQPIPLPPPPPLPPRVAILDFVESAGPGVFPPGTGAWTAGQLAPYFSPPYEIVDRSEVFWYMGRMSMTMHDVLSDASARRWLGRALNIRYFVMGTLRETRSFDVTAHMIEAETGFVYGHGRIHCRNTFDLKLRLGDLARQTMMSPEERRRLEQEQRAYDELVARARLAHDRGQFVLAIPLYEQSLSMRSGNVEIQVHLQRCRHLHRHAEIALARQREFERQREQAEAFQRRQMELARAGEFARQEAARRAALIAEGDRRAEEERRLREQAAAQQQLMVQARFALKSKNFSLSLQFFESASRLRPTDDVYREMAQARADAERAAQGRAAEDAILREAALRQQREADLARLQREQEKESARRRAEFERRKAEEDRDHNQYRRLFDDGQRLLSAGKYDQAVQALQAARQVRKSDEVQALLSQALVEQARATAQAKGDAERRELERQLDLEKARRLQAEAAAKRNQEKYQLALQQARKAMTERKYDNAIAAYHDAGQVFKTDIVLTGLREAQTRKVQETALAKEVAEKAAQEQRKEGDFQKLLTEGQTAMQGKDFGKAIKAYADAKKLKPGNVDALTGLTKAEQLRAQTLADARRKADDEARDRSLGQFLSAGKVNLDSRQYDAAILALNEALKISPVNPNAKKWLADAETGKKALARNAAQEAEAKKKSDAYQKALADGRVALNLKRWDLALKNFQDAQGFLPGDNTSAGLMKEAQTGKQAAESKLLAEAKLRAEALKRDAAFKSALDQARTALGKKDLTAASKAVLDAAEIAPQNPELLRVRDDLRKAQDTARAEELVQKQRDQQFQGLLTKGKSAEATKKYGDAIKAYADAVALMPQDKGARVLLQAAQKAQRDADLAIQQAALAEKTKQYQAAIKAGQTALTAKKYDDAVKAFQTASSIFPEDKTAAALLKRARDEAALGPQLTALVDAGAKAIKAGKLTEARKQYDASVKLAPRDPAVVQLGTDLTRAENAAQAATDQAQKKLLYDKALKDGQDALKKNQFDQAIKLFQDAGKYVPNDKTADAWLQQARTAQGQAQKTAAAEAKKKADFDGFMNQGQKAMTAKKYGEAITAFDGALKIMPGNPQATQLLAQARQLQGTGTPVPPKVTFQEQMDKATALEKQKKWAEAIAIYQDLSKERPKDAKLSGALKDARFNLHMEDGQKFLDQRKYVEAVRQFEAAVAIQPSNQKAQAQLKAAKKMGK